jgi:TonB family protein
MRTKLLLACFSAAPLLMAASDPVRLQPSSQWVVDYADNSCRLIRMFGTGDDETKLVLESMAPDDIGMLVVSRQLGGVFPTAQINARFVPGQDNFFAGTPAQTEQNGRAAALWSHFPLMPILKLDGLLPAQLKTAMDEARSPAKSSQRPPPIDLNKRAAERAERLRFAAKVSDLEIEPRPGHAVILETGSLDAPVEVFDACIRDLMKGWGIDPAVQDKITRPAWTAKLWAWFSAGDYPVDALRQGQESQVTFQLVVDATGKVTRCTAISPYDAPIFNVAVCNVLKQRARFTPAELSDGTKVPSYYTNTVTFRMGF